MQQGETQDQPAGAAAARERARPGRPRTGEIEQRKEAILDIAAQMFLEQGYAGTSFVDIARKANAGTKTLYQHFGDKEGLFKEVVFARQLPGPSIVPYRLQDETLSDTLLRIANSAWDYLLDPKTIDMMRLRIAEGRRFPDLMRKVSLASRSRLRAIFSGIFQSLAVEELIPDGDHQTSAKYFLDLMIGASTLAIYSDWVAIRPSQQELEEKVELFVRGRLGGAGLSSCTRSGRESASAA